MPVTPPAERNWWQLPLGKQEKVWLVLVVLVGLGLFLMMPLWHAFGKQNPPTDTYRVNPEAYYQKVSQITQTYTKVAQGVKPPGNEVYFAALRYGWQPNPLVLEVGKEYRFHISSKDVQHGFSVHKAGEPGQKINLQVVPGYEMVATMKFEDAGTYYIVCQEYCGIGHEFMVGQIIVEGGR